MELEGRRKFGSFGRGNMSKKLDARFYIVFRCLIYMGLGMGMSCARVLETGAPLGMAMVACSGAGLTGVFALLGAAIGYLLSGGLEWGIRYVAASVLVYTISFVFQELKISKHEFFMPAASACVMAVTALLGNPALGQAMPLYAKIFPETVMAFGGAYFFREALTDTLRMTEGEELKHSTAVLVMAACALMAFARAVLFKTVSVGRVIALLLVMTSAYRGGMLTGAAVGTVFGMAMDVTRISSPFYTMSYAFSGLLSGAFGKRGKVIFTLSFILAGTLSVICVWNTEVYITALFENFCASVIYMALPNRVLNRVGLMLQAVEKGSGEAGLRRFAAGRVRNLSQAYGTLYETVRRNMEEPFNDENIATVFDRAADMVCAECKNKNRCWNSDFMDTLSAMNDATRAMSEKGSLESADLPGYFRESCTHLESFVAAVNGELRSFSYRRQLKAHLQENRNVVWSQYSDIAHILSHVADELGSVNGSDPLAERRMTRLLKSMDIEAQTSVFRDAAGRARVIIESPQLNSLLKIDGILEKLSGVAGVKLCVPAEGGVGSMKLTLIEAEPLAVSVGIAAMKKRGERVSGDKGTYFKTDSGVLCVILSDGMGTGDEAASDSNQVVEILEKFLRSGVDPAVAMKILNSVMLLRSNDSWGYATVDLMCVDLFTGDTCFYKYGAAPSYVMNGKSVSRINGEPLSSRMNGSDGVVPDLVRMHLHPGSTAIIASDGVIAGLEDEWVKAILGKGFEDMKALARSTLKEAERLYGANDDMTVVAVRVEERV
ncbi:MAG: SpoIIE family protein phosphatase [Eubacteriales bacterium]|nr:SpoIIE family protein phosphatase [Eubacteriales bacterium]